MKGNETLHLSYEFLFQSFSFWKNESDQRGNVVRDVLTAQAEWDNNSFAIAARE